MKYYLGYLHSLVINGYHGEKPDNLDISDTYFMNTTTVDPLYEVYYNLQITNSDTHVLNQSSYFAILLTSPLCGYSIVLIFSPGRYRFFAVCQVLLLCLTARGEYSRGYKVFIKQIVFFSNLSCYDKSGNNPFSPYLFEPQVNITLELTGIAL